MGKSTHFFGEPILSQLLNYLDKEKILEISRSNWEILLEKMVEKPLEQD